MAVLEATISSATADDAREELERYNRDDIAAAKSSGRVRALDLQTSSSSTNLQRAYAESETAIRKSRPKASLKQPRPVLLNSRPPKPGVASHVLACLALGKIGGKDAEELKKGGIYIWEQGEKLEFGDADDIYIGFRVEESTE